MKEESPATWLIGFKYLTNEFLEKASLAVKKGRQS